MLWSQPPALTSGGQSIGASASALVLPTIFRIDFFRIGWLVLAVLGTFKSLLQHGSSKTPFLHCSAFFMVQLSHPYMTNRRIMVLTLQTFAGQVMSLLFNTLCSFVIAFLPRSKHLLITITCLLIHCDSLLIL